MSYLGVDLAAKMYAVFGSKVNSFTLTRHTFTARTPGSLTAGTNESTANHSCKGYLAEYDDNLLEATTIRKGDRMAVLLADSFSDQTVLPPIAGDSLTADSIAYEVISVERDASAAEYVCQLRGPAA